MGGRGERLQVISLADQEGPDAEGLGCQAQEVGLEMWHIALRKPL